MRQAAARLSALDYDREVGLLAKCDGAAHFLPILMIARQIRHRSTQ
jgi:hypothetical protein